MKLLLDIANMFGHSTQFQFRFDVHLVVQVCLDAIFGSLRTLADQDENGRYIQELTSLSTKGGNHIYKLFKQHKDGLNPWCKSCYSDAGKIRYEKRCLKNPPSFRRICDRIHHTYFSVVDQPLQAYLPGLLAADGNILERFSRITMELSVKDDELLTLVRDGLAPGYSIRKRVRKEPTRFGTGASGTVTFTSRQMVADLARFNIGPKKTLTIRWPLNLPMNLAPAYLLRYFDGDGFITSYVASNHTYAVWGLTSGSIEFLNDVISIVKEQTGITIRGPYRKSSQSFVIRAYGTRAVAIDQWLHGDGLGLSRKRV